MTQIKTLQSSPTAAASCPSRTSPSASGLSLPGRQPHRRRAPAPRLARAPRGRARPPHEAHRASPTDGRDVARRIDEARLEGLEEFTASLPPEQRDRALRRPRRPPPPHMTRITRRHHRRQPPLVDPRRDVLRAVHDHARQHGRERRAAVDPARPRQLDRRPRVDRQRLHAVLRRPARHRRAPRRHLRPPPDVPLRRRRLRRCRAPSSASRRPTRGSSPAAPSRASAPRS